MLITQKDTQKSIEMDGFPQILKLNSGGIPLGWITYEDSVYHEVKGNILWSMGEYSRLEWNWLMFHMCLLIMNL